MHKFKSISPLTFSLAVLLLTLAVGIIGENSSPLTAQAQQISPRKYLIKPLNLATNTEIRARSTRNIQVRVTDENDRPVPDAPLLFMLSNTGSKSAGSFAGQTSIRVMTNTQGVAQVNYTAGDRAGSAKIKIQVEGADTAWEGTLLTVSALAGVMEAQNTASFVTGLLKGQMPKSSIAQQKFTTTEGKQFSLESLHGKVLVMQFFGVWCGVSKRQVPSLKEILNGSNEEKVAVVGMSVKDPRTTTQLFEQFLTGQHVNYAIVKDVADKHFVEFVNSRDVSVPQTLIYGRDGRLLGHFVGFNEQVSTAIEHIINEATQDTLVRK